MKIIDLSAITSTNRMPIKEGTLQFLQLAYQEMGAAAIIAMIGNSYNSLDVYILYGCTESTGGIYTNIAVGAVFYGGEIYIHNGSVFANPTGGNVVVANLTVTQYTTNADAVTFTDSIARNVHNIRTVSFAAGATGTGTLTLAATSDYGNLIAFNGSMIVNQYSAAGLTIQAGFSNLGGSTYPATCKIVDGNQCFLSGVITKASNITSSANIIQLPFTVAENINFPFQVLDGTSYTQFTLEVETTGMIRVLGTTTSGSAILQLEGISFRIA